MGRVLAVDGPARVRAEPFDAVELDLAPLWKRTTSGGDASGAEPTSGPDATADASPEHRER